MAIDMAKLAGAPGIRCTVQERWTIDGHDVALVRYRKRRERGPGSAHLVCECDTDTDDVIRDGRVVGRTSRRDPHKCRAKAETRRRVVAAVRPSCLEVLAAKGMEDAVASIHARVSSGEWLGQHHAGIIYAQEVAALLERPLPDVLAAVESLYAKERIDLNGMILCDFVPGFRFPKEVRSMLRMLIEAPLGWPNGDAGDIALAEMENAITKGTHFKRCADAFWDHNWPRVAPIHLVEFGLSFLDLALSRATAEDLQHVDRARLAERLKTLADGYRRFGTGPAPKSASRRPKKKGGGRKNRRRDK